MEWVWSSPRLDTLDGLPYGTGYIGTSSTATPRTIRTGDLDGDGLNEIIFARGGVGGGILIYEWDGVVGSHNFGKLPSAFIEQTIKYGSNFGPLAGTAVEGGLQLTIEQFDVKDVDGDGQQELVLPKNLTGTINDDFLIIHAVGTWEFETQGFATFEIEGSTFRTASIKYGGGSPYSAVPADLDGDGKFELVCNNYNYGDYWVMKNTAADTYVLPDSAAANSKRFYQQDYTKKYDLISLFGTTVADFDKDGNQEVYFPWYWGYQNPQVGYSLHMINYSPGDDVLEADSSHSFNISQAVSLNTLGETISSFRAAIGDLDRNGKDELLVGSFYPSMLVAIEYQSGDITKPENYLRKVYYPGEPDSYQSVSYRDSLGVLDTIRLRDETFCSKMTTPVDFDGDGKFEVILPQQGMWDSTSINWMHYSLEFSEFVTDSTVKITNPKKWIMRSIESDLLGSVGGKDYTVITPDDYQLNQNYPNPFNPTTTINFVLPLTKKVTVKIYDMIGKEVATLVNGEEYAKGSHDVVWNGRDRNGSTVASGAYIAKMNAGNVEKSIKMMMLK